MFSLPVDTFEHIFSFLGISVLSSVINRHIQQQALERDRSNCLLAERSRCFVFDEKYNIYH